MATCQSETVNDVLQGADQLEPYHSARFHEYLLARAAVVTLPPGVSDSDLDALLSDADETFENLMDAPAASFTAVMLKAKAAQLWTMQRTQASAMNPGVFAGFFANLAADLEILIAGTSARKAVRS